jgi:uncharacterized oxidoreductase
MILTLAVAKLTREPSEMSRISLNSKHIVLTGGTSGIGYEIIRQLNSNNRLSVIARASTRLDALKAEFPKLRVYEADLGNLEAVKRAADEIVQSGDAIDILINNAAVQHTPLFLDEDFRLETIEREIDINLTAPAILIYLTLPALLASKRATVLNINSGLALVPKTSSAVYCAAKGGLNILSQSLANQFEYSTVRVVQAFLPLVDTEMTKGRGTGKISAAHAATKVLQGLETGAETINIGKVKLLRLMMRLSPSLARKIMRKG